MAFLYFASLYILATLHTLVFASRLAAIPTFPFTASAGGGTYRLSSLKSIIIDSAYADRVDKSGETTTPQTLHQFGGVISSDILTIWGLENISLPTGPAAQHDSIFLTLSDSPSYQYANGEESAEGYELEVTTLGVTIRGASPLGVWWGSRSLLQLAILSNGELPLGRVVDSPGWKIRGMMLDVGRHYYPSDFITNICSYMSFFKQNTLQLHLSDNLYNNVKLYSREQSLSLYARFRLWSDAPEVAGLNKFINESYTKDDWEQMQHACVARGVTIIPEIEAPGHALPIVQWKPELGMSSDLSLLNLSHPDTLPTMQTIWGTFMDWFTCKTVHIGADEYTGNASEYNHFVNEMSGFIQSNGSKSVRIWGTFPPKPDYDDNISKDVSIQHWEFFEDNPLFDYIQNNYSVVNSDDTFYVVNKWSGSYPQKVNINKTFHGNPVSGGFWEPYIFDTKNSSNNPDRSNPNILGSIAPLWNDYGPNATVYSEAYYAWREGIPALADKQWGGTLLTEEFINVLPRLHPYIPDQFLEKTILSDGPEILRFDLESWAHARQADGDDKVGEIWEVKDLTTNGYSGRTNCSVTPNQTIAMNTNCAITTELLSKGRDYSLTLRLYVTHVADDAPIISGRDSVLMLTPNLTLFAAGNYYRLNTTVPLYTWFDLNLVGLGERTFASIRQVRLGDPLVARVDDREEFLAVLGINGESLVWAPIAIEAPLTDIWGSNEQWTGEFAGMLLTTDVPQ